MCLLFQLKFNGPEGQYGTLAEEFVNTCIPTETQFTEHLLASRLAGTMKHTAVKRAPFHPNSAALKLLCLCSTFRLEKYKYFKLEQLMMNLKENSTEDTNIGRTIVVFFLGWCN